MGIKDNFKSRINRGIIKVNDVINNLLDIFYLENYEHKAKLIENLLIISVLFTGFKLLPDEMNWMFFMFVAFSIAYFIQIQKKWVEIKYNKSINFMALFISVLFSAILAYSIALSSTSDVLNIILKFIGSTIIFILYYLIFSFIIYSALRVKS